MKHIQLLIILFALIPWRLHAQQADTVRMRAYYIATFKHYTDQKNFMTEEKELVVGKERTDFYGRWEHLKQKEIDSLTKVNGSIEEVYRIRDKYPRTYESYAIYDNFPQPGKRTVTDKLFKSFYYEEDIVPIAWEVDPRDTTILDLPCLFATCHYGGRLWKVCFTTAIPVQAGPWKLRGLPGLIVYAQDDSGVFTFECIQIKPGDGTEVSTPSLSRKIKCTRQELDKLQMESASDPVEYAKKFGMTGPHLTRDGKPIVYPKQTPYFMEK